MAKRTTTQADKPKRRKRCEGECGNLFPPDELSRVGLRWVCQDCVTAEAKQAAPPESEDAKQARLARARKAAGTSKPSDPRDEPPPDPSSRISQQTKDELGLVPASSLLPASSTQVNLGDPVEKFKQWRALPDEKPADVVWPLRYGRVSPSALGAFMRCPEQFRRKYIAGIKEPMNASMVSGNAAHAGLTAFFDAMLQGGSINLRTVKEWLYAKIDYDESKADINWGDTNRDHAGFRAMSAVETYLSNAAPYITPQAVDEPFSLRIPGVPVPVCGVIDLRASYMDGPPENIDWKIGKNVSNEVSPEWRLQGLMYMAGDDPKPTSFHSIGYPRKDGTCGISTGDTMRIDASAANFAIARDIVRSAVAAILAYHREFGSEAAWPGGGLTHTWACKGCHFREHGCKWWAQAADLVVDPFV